MPAINLGISAYYHDSAAVLSIDGQIIAAAQEERFTRKKHDPSFPSNAIKYVLNEAGVEPSEISYVVFYEKPFIKFERLLETYHAFAPRGFKNFASAIPVWIKEKLFLKKTLKEELKNLGIDNAQLLFPEHHLSHAASAFYPSPFEEAAILTLDGVGEWATTTIGRGQGSDIQILKELHFPHSLGLLYSAFTYYIGFRVNSGEYKLMGLAPYGNPDSSQTKLFKEIITKQLVDIKDDGSILLNMKYFNFATGLKMTHNKKWKRLFGFPARHPDNELSQEHMNMALAIQQITEDIVLKLAQTAKAITQSNKLVLSGGVALNSVANGKILKSGLFDELWIQPAAGDAGGALGASLLAYYLKKENKRIPQTNPDAMKGAYLGPDFNDKDVETIIRKYNPAFEYYNNIDELNRLTAEKIASGKVVGWFQGKMEFGPRALGNRSILGDPRNPEMQKKLNLKIKYREGFRPFAPSVLEEDIREYFDLDRPSPYMLLVIPVKDKRRKALPENYYELELYDRLYQERSDIPAITHIDFSARIQSVNKNTNPKYWNLINEFKKITGYGILINTSFNVRGEPIVCTPEEAFSCFMRTEMDYLVINNYVFEKSKMNKLKQDFNWDKAFGED
jgi:carbamoyltransferase